MLLFLTVFLLICYENETVKFGAILRKTEDAHLVAAFVYAIKWINRSRFHPIDYRIEYIDSFDYYEADIKACKLLEEEDVIVLFSSADPYLNFYIEKIANLVEIPFFAIADSFREDDSRDKPSTIQIFPSSQFFEAIGDLFDYWHWSRVVVVYSDSERIGRLGLLFEKERFKSIQFVFIKIKFGNYLKATKQIAELGGCELSNKKDCSEFRVLLDLDPEDTFQFLIAALQVGLINVKRWFLLTSLEIKTMDMELFRHNHARFVALDIVIPDFRVVHSGDFSYADFVKFVQSEWRRAGKNDRELKLSEAILMFDSIMMASVASEKLNFEGQTPAKCQSSTDPYKQFSQGQLFTKAIKNLEMNGLSGDLRRVAGFSNNFSFRINLLGYDGEIRDVGFWKPRKDIYVNLSLDSKAHIRQNMQMSNELKPHLKVTTILERPYVMMVKNDSGNLRLEGFCIDLLAELAQDLGFTYKITLVKDKKYGNDEYKNGSWDGMIHEILRGEADIAIAPLTVNFMRSDVVDFTKHFLSLGISILYRIPSTNQPELFSTLNPLPNEIWVCILLAIVGLIIAMYTIAHLTPFEWNLNFSCCTAHQPHPLAEFSSELPIQFANNYSFWNTIWYVMSTMLKGGCDFGPRAISTRLLGGTWWVFILVIVAAYTANLAAVLTVSKPFIPIKNLDDLANQSKISFGALLGGSTMQFFRESKIPGHVKIWNYMKENNVTVGSNANGVERVVNEDYAFLMESSSLEYELQQNCNLTQIGGVLGSKGYSIALKKKSEWTDKLSKQILLYAKRGILDMKKTKWWRSKSTTCTRSASPIAKQRLALNLQNISGLFVILITGLSIAYLTVMCEYFNKYLQHFRNVNKVIENNHGRNNNS